MNRILIAILISAILALIAYSLLSDPCPPANQIIAQWEKIADDYHSGKISFEESIRRSDKLIQCSENLREKRSNCNRKTHTVPCSQKNKRKNSPKGSPFSSPNK